MAGCTHHGITRRRPVKARPETLLAIFSRCEAQAWPKLSSVQVTTKTRRSVTEKTFVDCQQSLLLGFTNRTAHGEDRENAAFVKLRAVIIASTQRPLMLIEPSRR